MFIIVTNHANGVVYGPFVDETAARVYAKKNCVGCCWRVLSLIK